MTNRTRRGIAVALAGGTAAALLTLTPSPALASVPRPAPPAPSPTPPSSPLSSSSVPSVPPFDFRDCPALPAGVDPAKWRCEVFTMDSGLRIGALDVPALAPMTVTNSEGPLPDGSKGQVFGALRSAATAVKGAPAPFGGLRVQPRYAGFSDFYSDGVHRGALDVTFRLLHPLLGGQGRGGACAIGSDADPVKLRFLQDGDTEWVSKEPPVLKFAMHDAAFATPRVHGCGPLNRLAGKRLRVPAPAGDGKISATARYTFRSYDRLPGGLV
ncbi:hypothetical protein ACIQNI_16960 [Streptomyces sp. NPDC091266]|uniref:hypothetical protein n=1 Tax=Streptomyces sp. NPDC091266 TaxID=3365978 RepID=UPI00382566D0